MKTKTNAYRFDSPEELRILIDRFGPDHFKYIPQHNPHSGFLYEKETVNEHKMVTWGGWTSASMERFNKDYLDYFIPINFKDAMNIVGAYPFNLLNKKVKRKGITLTVKAIALYDSKNPPLHLSYAVEEYGECNKNFYYILTTCGLEYPVDEVTPFNEIVVKLNDKHDAIVTKDKIIVGCQTFSPDIIEKLYKAHKDIS